jgi:hypothetical protein
MKTKYQHPKFSHCLSLPRCPARGDNSHLPAPPALSPNSLWIYTMNRCTLALRGRALLCLDFITSLNAVEAA